MKRPTLAPTAGVCVIAALMVVVSSPPAHAAKEQCRGGQICAWLGGDFDGPFRAFPSSTPALGDFDNSISAQLNNSRATALWWDSLQYSGDVFRVPPGGGGHFSAFDVRNDTFSSLQVY